MAGQNENRGSIKIATLREQLFKQYHTYDGSNRLIKTYEAYTEAEDGAPCIVTDLEYDGTSSRIVKVKESQGVWSAAYDI